MFQTPKKTNVHIERAYHIPKKIDSEQSNLRHILERQLDLKGNEKILWVSRQKVQTTYKKKLRMAWHSSREIYQAQKQ